MTKSKFDEVYTKEDLLEALSNIDDLIPDEDRTCFTYWANQIEKCYDYVVGRLGDEQKERFNVSRN